jgi:hypothetical protein
VKRIYISTTDIYIYIYTYIYTYLSITDILIPFVFDEEEQRIVRGVEATALYFRLALVEAKGKRKGGTDGRVEGGEGRKGGGIVKER